jgi:hypothetical protein
VVALLWKVGNKDMNVLWIILIVVELCMGIRTYINAEDKLDKILAFEMLILAQGMTISMKLK